MQTPPGWRQTLTSCWVFPAAILWKLVLIGAASLPPPGNDAFFFDGAVAQWLRGGAYVNPSIVRVFPTSGGEFFSAYPPFYQAVLAAWMSVCGTSAWSSQWLHGGLFAVFALLTLAVLRRLGAPATAVNVGGLFLFGLTFHDRPDSVAHVVGLLALYAWMRAADAGASAARWRGAAAALIVLTVATSLHIGAMYAAMLWVHAALRSRREAWPWRPMLAMVLVPAGLGAAVAFGWPRAWQGFSENLLATPSFTGYRLPAVEDILKIGRTVPGVLLIAGVGMVLAVRRPRAVVGGEVLPAADVFGAVLVAAGFAAVATLVVVAPNYVHVVAYPQVLVVALFVWLVLPELAVSRMGRWVRPALLGAAALVSIRAVGLSTWGVACAVDVSRTEATVRVRRAIDGLPKDSAALVSSAYLYDLVGERRVTCLHADWVGRFGEGEGAFRPACLVLTSYDYHRRYARTLAELAARGRVTVVGVEQAGRVPPPDGFPRWQRVVQHLSWAPVIVRVEWH